MKKIHRSLKMPKIFITSQQKLKALVIKIMKIREKIHDSQQKYLK